MRRVSFWSLTVLLFAILAAQAYKPPVEAAPTPSVTYSPLKNWGLTNTQALTHINALQAWDEVQAHNTVVVAVIDTGIDSSHKDLAANLWRDPNIKDDVIFGWNFQTGHANPIDDHGHGTHIAGIIGATFDAETGVAGVAKNVQIMPIKYYSDANPGSVNLRHTIEALNYAVASGAQIINYSGGGPEFSEDEYLAIKLAESKGILVVAAAGNEHANTDLVENYYYPAAYRLSNIVSVMAYDINGQKLASSNYGERTVDIAAPGENIYSTLPGGRYGYMSGTSQATAFVTGTAALLLSEDPTLKPAEIKEILKSSARRTQYLKGKVQSGQLDALAALYAARKYRASRK